MTVAELIRQLNVLDPSRIVILAKDAEGNGYSPLTACWAGAYKAETTWSGEVGLDKLTAEDSRQGYTEEDVIDGVPAVILSPTC